MEEESIKPIIKVKNLNVTYFKGKPNETRPLKNINLEIYPGEFIILAPLAAENLPCFIAFLV